MAQRIRAKYTKKKRVIPKYSSDTHTEGETGRSKRTWIREGWCDCMETVIGFDEWCREVMEVVMEAGKCPCGITTEHSHCAYCSRLVKWD